MRAPNLQVLDGQLLGPAAQSQNFYNSCCHILFLFVTIGLYNDRIARSIIYMYVYI
jgi:hypothetical protein